MALSSGHEVPSQDLDSPAWPESLSSTRDMTYESLDLLHLDPKPGGDMSFVVSASKRTIFRPGQPDAVIHKVDITNQPSLTTTNIRVSHEVVPGLRACSRIIPVNEKLKVAGFDTGKVMPISNFGHKKTFHTNVRDTLHHHQGLVTCLAADRAGTQVASGCTSGRIVLYQVRQEELSFLTRTDDTVASFITDMTFFQPSTGFNFGQQDPASFHGENSLLYSAHDGHIGLLDTRCGFARPVSAEIISTLEEPMNILSILVLKTKPSHNIYIGSASGSLSISDLRMGGRIARQIRSPEVRSIQRMKEVVINSPGGDHTFIAHTTGSNVIRILDAETMESNANWSCGRLPNATVRDMSQVGTRIVTCGDKTSIGYWDQNTTTQSCVY